MSKSIMRKMICFILAIMVLSCSALAIGEQFEIENNSPRRTIGLTGLVATLNINDNGIAKCYTYIEQLD